MASTRQRRHEVLAAAEVEPGGRLVEQQQLGVGHQRAGDLDPLALALAEGAEGAVGQVRRPRPPRAASAARSWSRSSYSSRQRPTTPYDAETTTSLHQLAARDPLGERGAGQADPRPQLEDVDGAEHLVEDPGDAGGRVELRGGDLEQRGLAGAVGSEDHPALVLLDRPVDVVEQRGLAPAHRDAGELEDGGHARHPIQHRPRRGPGHGGAGRRVASPAMSRTHLALPHSATLAWWVTAWLRGHVVADHVIDAVADDTHLVAGGSTLDLLVRARGAGASYAGLALPVDGDPVGLGGPRDFNAAALEAGEAVVVGDLGPGARGAGRDGAVARPRGVAPPAARRRRGRPRPAWRAPRRGGRPGRPRRGPLAARGRRRADEPAPPPAPSTPRSAPRRGASTSPRAACRRGRSSTWPSRTTAVR